MRLLLAAGVLLAFLIAGFTITVAPPPLPAGPALPAAPPAPRPSPEAPRPRRAPAPLPTVDGLLLR